ncbi:MAG: hypothetical protein JRJ06_02615 [Deltaproteobacteria bacterium]|nr:hypothetical protein [Deltaproteobacteria bacterium]
MKKAKLIPAFCAKYRSEAPKASCLKGNWSFKDKALQATAGNWCKIQVIIFIPFFFIILNFAILPAQETSGPRMVLEETLFDAKEVKEKTIIVHDFKVLNTGDMPLEIKKVKPG